MIPLERLHNNNFMKRFIATTVFTFLSSLIIVGQNIKTFQGFDKTVSGFNFNYHTPLKDYGACLLSRAQAEYQPIIWVTETVPENYDRETITFLWAYGMDVTPDSRSFDFYVNGEKYFTISNPLNNDLREWSVRGKEGAVLRFNVTKIDKYKDQMGFASLTLPLSSIVPGKALTLKVDGEKAKSNSWYMTFTEKLEEQFNVIQKDLIAKKDKKLFYVIGIDFTNIGEKAKGEIRVSDMIKNVDIQPGSNHYEVLVPKTASVGNTNVVLKINGKKELSENIEIKPIKEWTVYLVEHTHTDIGYTRPQTEILPEHLRYIDYALDYCDQTDDYPDNAKFRWSCEASWPVREYLESRPEEQIERLVKRVQEGRIEVTGMFFNYGEIVDETNLAAQLQSLSNFKKAGIHVQTLMQDDVNGIGWALVDYAQNTGVKYVLMGEHGHRARIPFSMPTAFWWESPSGKRLLAYRAEHYMHGNVLGLTSGSLETFKNGLANYLSQLNEKGYPFSETAFQFSGSITDNAPPSTVACEIVKQWDENYEWPKLRLSVASDFLSLLEKEHADELNVYRLAWPDWWADGFGTAMRETQAVRLTQEDMIANTGLLAMAKLKGAILPDVIHDDIRNVRDALLFYDEHTFGADESISNPLSENSMVQWAEKSSYAWDAVMKSRLLKEKAMGFIQPFFQKTDVPVIVVFNTLNWSRSGLVKVFIDHEIIPLDKGFRIVDNDNREIKAQFLKNQGGGAYWGIWVEDIPSFGYKTYRIEVKGENRKLPDENPAVYEFDNNFYQIKLDETTGTIVSIFDKELQIELTDSHDSLRTGQFIYEQLDNRHQMERYTSSKTDTVYVPLEGNRISLEDVRVLSMKNGPVWKSLYLNGKIPGCADEKGVDIEIRLYHNEKRIGFFYNMNKLPVKTAESVYIAFPFSLPNGKIIYEAQGGMVEPGINQLEGTSTDWNAIQHFASVKNNKTQIVFSSMDVPLVQFGDINTGRFYYKHQPETSHIFSWVLNNYWTTNFRTSQEGELKWGYSITSGNDTTNNFATRFAWGSSTPFLTRVLPQGNTSSPLKDESLINIEAQNVLLVNAQLSNDEKGIVLHLRETDGKPATIDLRKLANSKKPKLITQVNVLGEKIKSLSGKLEMMPYEVIFITIE